ncbi:hypothetical protein J6590_052201 [Homalodisca vitripennis]|nr:hypothetical protein J6590_052201 [Homalodisca vitripennis]
MHVLMPCGIDVKTDKRDRKQRPADLYHPSPTTEELAAQALARPLVESPHRVIPETETVLADLYHPSPATEELAAQALARPLVESPHRVIPETEIVLTDLYHPSTTKDQLAAQARARPLMESPHRVMYIVPGYLPEK